MTALAAAIGRRDLWPYAAATFLLHGGLAIVALPILVLPSPVGITTFFGPTSVTPTGPSPALVAFGAAVAAMVLIWALVGGLAAAAAEALLVAGSVDGPEPAVGRRLAARIATARGIAALPIFLALVWSLPRLAAAGYGELIRPSDPADPFLFRVLAATPETVVVVVMAWLLAGATGAVAARRIVLLDEPVLAASWRAVRLLARRPDRSLARIGAGACGWLILVGGSLVGARGLWLAVTGALDGGIGPQAVGPIVAFVAAWALALVAAGLVGTWQNVVWTAVACPTATLRGAASPGGAANGPNLA